MNPKDYRREYTRSELNKKDLSPDPIQQFSQWFDEVDRKQFLEPNAMILATFNPITGPSLRTVLLKELNNNCFVFFTNYTSKKAQEIAANPQVSLLFSWLPLERQVIVKGTTEKISPNDSSDYFKQRPRGSQISAWASRQSTVIPDKDFLKQKWERTEQKFKDNLVPTPPFWGGYQVIPQEIEFWQGQPDRLHDRMLYIKTANQEWKIERLSP